MEPPSEGHSQLDGSNSSYIQRVTSTWEENTVTWNNQPSVSPSNRVIIPEGSSPSQDYVDLDITGLVQDILDDPAGNFGIMISLIEERRRRALYFASSDYETVSKRPRLTVEFEQ